MAYPSAQVLLDGKDFLGTEVRIEQVMGRTVEDLVREGWLADKYSEMERNEVINKNNFISSFMQKLMVDRYSIAIKNLRSGLTLDGEFR